MADLVAVSCMNILVVDDHPLVRKGIIDIIQITKKDIKMYEAGNLEEAIKIIQTKHIDILLVDINLGKDNGFDLVEKTKKLGLPLKVVMLTSSCNFNDIKKAQDLEVNGYILKDAYIDDIQYALNVIERGDTYYSPHIAKFTISGIGMKDMNELTERELEVLAKLSLGLSNSQISKALYITEGTTKKHVSNILAKLNMSSRIEAVIYARDTFGYSMK